jgi:hypothetical protein
MPFNAIGMVQFHFMCHSEQEMAHAIYLSHSIPPFFKTPRRASTTSIKASSVFLSQFGHEPLDQDLGEPG